MPAGQLSVLQLRQSLLALFLQDVASQVTPSSQGAEQLVQTLSVYKSPRFLYMPAGQLALMGVLSTGLRSCVPPSLHPVMKYLSGGNLNASTLQLAQYPSASAVHGT